MKPTSNQKRYEGPKRVEIPTNFIGHVPEIDKETTPYSDIDFPPVAKSICGLKGKPHSSFAAFKRPIDCPSEDNQAPALFQNGSGFGDVMQGALGDCWFLSALAVIASRPDVLNYNIFLDSKYPKRGHYAFRFFHNFEWKVVHIDDFLPVGEGDGLLFSSCKDSKELWVPLIEKAFAKLHGSYEALEAGLAGDGVVSLTGGVWWSETVNKQNMNAIFEKLQKWHKEGGYFIATSSETKEKNTFGIVTSHAYSVLDALTVDGNRLVKIRNPWGNTEWKGRWSDTDKQNWTPEMKRTLNHHGEDDGTFFMPLEDFAKFYTDIDVVRIFNDPVEADKKLALGLISKKEQALQWKCQAFVGEINKSRGYFGEQSNLDNATFFDQFLLEFEGKPAEIYIDMMQSDLRDKITETGKRGNYPAIAVEVFKMPENTKMSGPIEKMKYSSFLFETGYACKKENCHYRTMQPGKYILIPAIWEKGPSTGYLLRVYVNGVPFKLSNMKNAGKNTDVPIVKNVVTPQVVPVVNPNVVPIVNPQVVPSINPQVVPIVNPKVVPIVNPKVVPQLPTFSKAWKNHKWSIAAGTARGRPTNDDSWIHNPQYLVKVSPKGDITNEDLDLYLDLTLKQVNNQQQHDIGLNVVLPNPIDDNMAVTVLMQETEEPVTFTKGIFTKSMKVDFDTSYVVIPSTYNPNCESDFYLEATVHGEQAGNVEVSLSPTTRFTRKVWNGEWNASTSGGCRKYRDTWQKNPQFHIVFREKENNGEDIEPDLAPTVQISITGAPYHVGIDIFDDDYGEPHVQGARVLATTEYMAKGCTVELFDPEFVHDYTLVPSTLGQNQIGKFQLIFDYHPAFEMTISQKK